MLWKLEGNGTYLGTVSHNSFEQAKELLLARFKKAIDGRFTIKEKGDSLSLNIRKVDDMWKVGRELGCLGDIHADPPDSYRMSPMEFKPGIDITNGYSD